MTCRFLLSWTLLTPVQPATYSPNVARIFASALGKLFSTQILRRLPSRQMPGTYMFASEIPPISLSRALSRRSARPIERQNEVRFRPPHALAVADGVSRKARQARLLGQACRQPKVRRAAYLSRSHQRLHHPTRDERGVHTDYPAGPSRTSHENSYRRQTALTQTSAPRAVKRRTSSPMLCEPESDAAGDVNTLRAHRH